MFVAILLAWADIARGYKVGPPLSVEKLAAESDIIFKGTAVFGGLVQDEWFKPYSNFVAQETQFKVISVIKGGPPGAMLQFRHYDKSPRRMGHCVQPQYYHFQSNRTYIVFAKKTERAGVYRQLWVNHKGMEDQGVLLCSDDQPVTAPTVKETLWNELTVMLRSDDVSNVTYAIHQLDQMSGGGHRFENTQDFDRTNVLAVVHDLMEHSASEVAQAAIVVVGSHNPYLSDERTVFWLATVGGAEAPGIGKMDPKMKNTGGELYEKDLVIIADSNAPAETRALAIRALGLVRKPVLREAINYWLADSEPAIRASATVLLADYPAPETNRRLIALASDSAPEVRAEVARAIGYSQQKELANVLGKLLADKDAKVRKTAAMSLLSFSPKNEGIAEVLRANLENAEFQPLFLNALARENPEPYRDGLARAVEEKTEPTNWWGGTAPAFDAWDILFKYIQHQPVDSVRSGKLDRYLDAIEKVGNYSSSEPRDIYAFYVQRGMSELAKKFREKANKAASYDLDYFFKQVDQNPSLYKRE
ncbi:MAG: HEAT repeat domain-containing protein [Syntrophales bacterium]|nr:HEAT repeat domain-containing protein [Syntrophales bacterium]